MVTVIAADLGSSSGRIMLGEFDGENLAVSELHRFPIRAREVGKTIQWDVPAIVAGVREGLDLATAHGTISSVAVDGWGVDHVVLGADGSPVAPVHAYRDPRTADVPAQIAERMPTPELWRATGIQPQQINTSHQLFALLRDHPEVRDGIERVVMLPDYVAHLLGGSVGWSRGICSTTGLAGPGAHEWSREVMTRLDIEPSWFGPISNERTVIGELDGTNAVLIRAGSHDTACAVHSLGPQDEPRVFLSAGSWSLLGMEVDEPLLGDEVRRAGLTNEARTDDGVRLLKNITGLWILQECQRQWSRGGQPADIVELVAGARAARSLDVVFDPDHADFQLPGPMADRVRAHLRRHHGREPADRGQLVRTVLESQAVAYARYVEQLVAVTGIRPRHLVMAGGGARNQLLVEMTAAACRIPVTLGQAEASALGSVVAQLEALGQISGSDDVRALLAGTSPETTVSPDDVRELDYLAALARS